MRTTALQVLLLALAVPWRSPPWPLWPAALPSPLQSPPQWQTQCRGCCTSADSLGLGSRWSCRSHYCDTEDACVPSDGGGVGRGGGRGAGGWLGYSISGGRGRGSGGIAVAAAAAAPLRQAARVLSSAGGGDGDEGALPMTGDHSGDSADGGYGGGAGVCTDTCPLARNGICEDGSIVLSSEPSDAADPHADPRVASGGGGRGGRWRLGKRPLATEKGNAASSSSLPSHAFGLTVACDPGTDCSDCGPYGGVMPRFGQSLNVSGPVEYLRRRGVRMWARRLAMAPHPVMAYTDPKADMDVSEQLERSGAMELGIVQIFQHVLRERCAPFKRQGGGAGMAGGGRPPLVVDVGANFGYFTVLAASLGCRVIAIEPVPRFLAFLHWNLAANGLRATNLTDPTAATDPTAVTVIDRVVSDVAGVNLTLTVPRRGVWGTANVLWTATTDQELEFISVPSVRLDDIVGDERVTLMKVDVEGYEPAVLRSARSLLAARRVEHLVMEYSPGLPEIQERGLSAEEAKGLPVRADEPPRMLLDLIRTGYRVVHLPDSFAKSGYAPQMKSPLPPLPEVLERSVQHDIADVDRFRRYSYGAERPPAGTPACPWPRELAEVNPLWGQGCFRPPEDSHPKGFRVTFFYNTNLWAFLTPPPGLNVSGPVGLFGPQQDDRRTWSSQRSPGLGAGARVCAYLPSGQLVRNRCDCANGTDPGANRRTQQQLQECRAELAVVMAAMEEGRLPLPLPTDTPLPAAEAAAPQFSARLRLRGGR